jgi:OFA family oxalate/formate antiporter-like MFS transporter
MIKINKNTGLRHYGWTVVLGCGFIFFYGLGLTVNMFSIFLTPLIESIGISKTSGSSIITAQYIVGLAGMLLGGSFYNRFSVRKGAFMFGLSIAAGYFVLAFSTSLWMCYMATVLTGLGYGGGSVIPTSILINRWFRERRGMALALAACGSGFAAVLFPPLVERIILYYGLTAAFIFQGASIAAMALASFLLIRDFPSEKGLLPYGETRGLPDPGKAENEPDPEETQDAQEVQDVQAVHIDGLKNLLSEKKFIFLMGTAIVTGMAILPPITHMAVFYTSSGYSTLFASAMLSVFGFIMLVGKPFYGAINDRFGTDKGNMFIFSVWVLAMISGLMLDRGTVFAYIFAASLGMGAAVSSITTPLWVADLFGSRNYGQIYAYFKFSMTIGGSISMTLPGLCADITGSYNPILALYLIFIVTVYILIRSMYKKYFIPPRPDRLSGTR